MTEGRRCQVVLLDERRLEILVQPKLYAADLLDIVASHFNLKEKDYFGLAYRDEAGDHNWLQLDRRVLEHDVPNKKSSTPLVLYFLIKFFVESISQLRDAVTVELFYLQAKSLVFKGQVEAESEIALQLAAFALQATHGDYSDDRTAKANLKKLPVLATSVLREHPSLSYCEDQVCSHYRKLCGQSRGAAVVNYMSVVETLPTYGVHYFEVKDKSGIPWWLGLGHKGIAQYDHGDRKTPRKVYQWRRLENLYFRDRKFSIEVHDPKRVSVSRRTFGPGNVTVCVWFAASPTLTKAIWSMAISQHQFYLDRKQAKHLSTGSRRLSDIAVELSTSRQSLSTSSGSVSNLSGSGSCRSLADKGGATDTNLCGEGFEVSEASKAARLEMMAALKARREALEAKLKTRTDDLKILCVKEAELTGRLPPETPLAPGEPAPQIRRRIRTAFTYPDNLVNKIMTKEEEDLANLELEYEIQRRIVSAAQKLAEDSGAKRSVRKQRKVNYRQSFTKLKDIEDKVSVMKEQVNKKMQARNQVKKKQPRPMTETPDDRFGGCDTPDGIIDFSGSGVDLQVTLSPCGDGTISPMISKGIVEESLVGVPQDTESRHPSSIGNSSSTSSLSVPTTPVGGHRIIPTSPCPSSRNASPQRFPSGYVPNSVYQTRSLYRSQQYPTLSTRSASTAYGGNPAECEDAISTGSSAESGSFSPTYRNRFDAGIPRESRGLYNVPMQRTSHAFQSQDGLTELECNPTFDPATLATRHNSLESSYRRHHHHQNQPTQHSNTPSLPSSPRQQHPHYQMVVMATSPRCPPPPTAWYGSLDRSVCGGGRVVPDEVDGPHQCLEVPQSEGPVNQITRLSPTTPRTQRAPPPKPLTLEVQVTRSPFSDTRHEFFSPTTSPIGSGSSMSVVSPKPKEKEWCETCLDSPVIVRKPSGCKRKRETMSPMSPLTSPSPCPSHAVDSFGLLHVTDPDQGTGFVPVPFASPRNHTVVSVGHFQPYKEETKPYELADYYKYSTKVRRQQQQQLRNGEEQADVVNGNVTRNQNTEQLTRRTTGGSSSSNAMFSEEGQWSPSKQQTMQTTPNCPSDVSFSPTNTGGSLADAFHEEMLAWYEDRETAKQATLV